MSVPAVAYRDGTVTVPSGAAILDRITLTIAAGERIAFLGRSGAGKTTALKTTNGLVTPSAGVVEVEGTPLAQQDLVTLRRRIGYVMQQPALFPHRTVFDNVATAQKLEGAGCKVERRLNMGGTFVCDSAIRSGAIDAYVEYSGTALSAILKNPSADVRSEYAKPGLRWSPRLGFNNTFAMIVRKADAERDRLRKVSDLARVASKIRPGFGYEFTERPDGWPGLQKAYGLAVTTTPRTMDLGLTYKALAAGEVDLIAGNSIDGVSEPLQLTILEDHRHDFPQYDAVVVTRTDLDQRCQRATIALESLRGTIDDAKMRRLDYEVDGKKHEAAEVVREGLR
ncbi:MAG TPA: glycine betaine ABC transporter substrate-binding protein [Thermoanaerobaculia bacterium]